MKEVARRVFRLYWKDQLIDTIHDYRATLVDDLSQIDEKVYSSVDEFTSGGAAEMWYRRGNHVNMKSRLFSYGYKIVLYLKGEQIVLQSGESLHGELKRVTSYEYAGDKCTLQEVIDETPIDDFIQYIKDHDTKVIVTKT